MTEEDKLYADELRKRAYSDYERLNMAIDKLEQQPITWIVGKDNCQVAVRNMPIDKMQKICAIIGEEEQQPKTIQEKQAESEKYQKAFDDGYENGYAQARFDYGQQPCEDCISREEAINVVHKYFVNYLKLNDDICLDGIRSLPSLTPSYNSIKTELKPCEDCISRKSVVEWLERCTDDSIEHAIDSNLDFIPSVTSQPKIGYWIKTKDECEGVNFYDFSFECSKCGKEQSFRSNYCPNCGADMRENDKNAKLD